jgi:hypothetical protein
LLQSLAARKTAFELNVMRKAGEIAAQADFRQAQALVAGVECRAHYLAIDLPHSDDTVAGW